MRGFPLLNLLLVSAALLVLLIPLLQVGRPSPPRPLPRVEPAEPVAGVPVLLLLRFVHPPQELSLTVAGKPLALRGDGLERSGAAALPLRERALELEFKAVWPPGTGSTMVELRAAPDGLPELHQNIWAAEAAADEIVSFTWRAAP